MPNIFTRRSRTFFQGADGPQYDKFSTKNKPTKRVFRWLFESIGFLGESNDTAQTDVQGFVQLNTDAEAQVRNSTSSANGFVKVTQAHHLAHIIADSNSDNPDGDGRTSNALSVRALYGTYGRTGGSGVTYIIKNTFTISFSDPLDFLTFNQTAPGSNVEFGFNSAAFNTKVSETTTITNISERVTNVIKAVATGYLGEIKMYSLFNEAMGSINCEFDINGVGRGEGVEGSTGNWIGWVILNGQSAATLKSPPYNAPDAIIDRISTGGVIMNTARSYPTGISTDVSENKGFQSKGANVHILSATETPTKGHYHTLSSNAHLSIVGGAHAHLLKGTKNDGAGTQLATGFQFAANLSDTDESTYMGQTGDSQGNGFDDPDGEIWSLGEKDLTTIENYYTNGGGHNYKNILYTSVSGVVKTMNPGHYHDNSEMSFGGKTDSISIVAAIEHNNRPLSFVVMYAMYIGTTGSLI